MTEKKIFHQIEFDKLYNYLIEKPDVIHSELVKDSEIIGLIILYFNDVIHLSNIYIHEEFQNQGYATEIMKILTEFSDDTGYIIKLSVRVMDSETWDLEQLVNFYKKFGFIVLEDHPVIVRMIYYPKK